MKRLFLAGLFKSLVDHHTGVMSEAHINLFSHIITHFESLGVGSTFRSPQGEIGTRVHESSRLHARRL